MNESHLLLRGDFLVDLHRRRPRAPLLGGRLLLRRPGRRRVRPLPGEPHQLHGEVLLDGVVVPVVLPRRHLVILGGHGASGRGCHRRQGCGQVRSCENELGLPYKDSELISGRKNIRSAATNSHLPDPDHKREVQIELYRAFMNTKFLLSEH